MKQWTKHEERYNAVFLKGVDVGAIPISEIAKEMSTHE